jgi:plasmid stability protein
MATLHLTNVDDEVFERLRAEADFHGVSIEEQACRILFEGTQLSRKEIAVRAAAIRARQPLSETRSVDLIREDRDR